MMVPGLAGAPFAAAGWFDLLLYGTCLAGVLLAAAAVIAMVRRWLRKGEGPLKPGDQLAHYRALYRKGEISQEEFDNLRAVLGEAQRPARPPSPPSPPAPSDGVRPE